MSTFDVDALKQLAQQSLVYAGQLGATAADINLAASKGFTVNARMGDIENLLYHRDQGLAITVYQGQRTGSASTSDLTEKAIKNAVEAAMAIAKYTDPDPYAGLADTFLMAKNIPDLQLYYPWQITPEQALELVIQCEASALSYNPDIKNSEGAHLSTEENCSVYANTHHFCEAVLSTTHSLSCSVVAERHGQMQRDYSYVYGTHPEVASQAIQLVGQEAASRTLRRLDAKRLTTRQAPVIFAADLARGLIGHFVSAVSGGALYRKASFLVDHLGKQIFPKHIEIYERPFLLGGLGSAAFDSEGVTTRDQHFIKNGILESYILGSYSARKLGLKTTANADGVHNLFVSTSDMDLPALFKAMGTGLYVTELMGQGANLITGDYSRGATGFWIENGEIAYPVEEITIAGNLREMYQKIIAIGKDVDQRGNIQTGSIWIENIMIGGE